MININIIDQQHHELVKKLNGLNDAFKNNASREDIYRIMDEVISHTRLHFVIEEQVMLQSGYPEIEAHKEKHKQLMQEALNLKEEFNYVEEQVFTEGFNHWTFPNVLAHIQYADKQMEEYVFRTDLNRMNA